MKDEFINKLELGLKNIIDNNIIFNLNLSCEDKYKKIISGLKIDNDLSKDDVEEINEVISSIKLFIEFISIYCEELVNITNNMEEKVNEFVDIFDKKRITSLEEPIEEIIKEKLNLEDIDDIEEKVNLDYFDWLEKSKYYSDLFKNSIDKEIKLLFEKINNDELFKKLIMNSEYGEEESILEENMIFLFRRNEYKLLDKVSFETALLAYNEGYYSLFNCFKDEYIDKLTKEQILTILPSINVGISALENKVKKIIKRVSFKEFNEHIISIAYSSMIYEMYDYIDDDSLDYICSGHYFFQLESNSYVINNKECIKKIIDSGKKDFIFKIPASVVDDDLYNYIVGGSNVGYLFKHNYYGNCKFLESYDLCLKVAQNITVNFDYFLDSIPKGCMKREFAIFCSLNGMEKNYSKTCEKYYHKSLDDIKYAIEKGYKSSTKTHISKKEELYTFIVNGQPEIIDYQNDLGNYNLIDLDAYVLALNNGYKFSDNTRFTNLTKKEIHQLFEFCMDNDYNELLPILYFRAYESFILNVRNYLESHPEYKSYQDFFIKKNVMDEMLERSIFDFQSLQFEGESWEDYAKEKLDNYETIKHYIYCYDQAKLPFFVDKNNINVYFDSKGPTKDFYKEVSCSGSIPLSYIISKLDRYSYIDILKDEPSYLSLIYFKKNSEKVCYADYSLIKDNINKYFDSKGPTKELYFLALYNNSWYNLLIITNPYNVNFEEIFNHDKTILSYIDFNKGFHARGYTSKIIKSIDDIKEYFDEEGMTRKLFDSIFFNKSEDLLFSNVFSDEGIDIDKIIANVSRVYKDEPEYVGYFKFRISHPEISYSLINPQIKRYFNEDEPTKDFYDFVLSIKDVSYFNSISSSWKLEKIYEDRPSVLKYIEYLRKYGQIFLNVISFRDIDKYFNEKGYTEALKQAYADHPDLTNFLLSELEHNDKVLENLLEDFVKMFEYYLIENYFMNCSNKKEKFDYLLNNIGPKIIFSLENDNIKKLIDYDIGDLDKLFGLFDTKTKLMSYQDTYNNFIVSILNYKFKKDYTNIREIFTNMNTEITKISIESLEKYLNTGKITDDTEKIDNYYRMIKYDLNLNREQIIELKSSIMECKKLNELPLRKICRKYLEFCQKKFFDDNKEKILREFWIEPYPDKDDKIKKIAQYLIENTFYHEFKDYRNELKNSLDYDNQTGFIDSLKMTKDEYDCILSLKLEEYELIKDAIENHTRPDDSIKKKYSLVKRFFVQYAKYGIEKNKISNVDIDIDIDNLHVKMLPQMPLENIDFINLLSEVDLDIYFNCIEKNPDLFNKLKKVCSNYGLGRLPSNMTSRFDYLFHIKLPGGINNIGVFITKFDQILTNKERILKAQGENRGLQNSILTFMETVNLISSVNSETYELKRLIGSNEYFDFISDKEPNDSTYSRLVREEKLSLIVDYLYTLGSITIPAHDMLIETKDTKYPINFIVGNRTNPSNICHGERTGACMRVGGIGEGLFLKCATDKNWFHIRIEEPNTHEYISRVSGFRNGNTVYLNQLRSVPSNCKYTNKDLQKYIKVYADTLIDETKDSEYPIENVFINGGTDRCYAMTGYEADNKRTYTLGYDIQKEYNLDDVQTLKIRESNNIWTDVKNSAVLLSTTEEGKKHNNGYVPIKNGIDNTLIYPVQRDKIYGLNYVENDIPKYCFIETDLFSLEEKINRVHAMKEKLLGSDYKYEINDIITDYENVLDGYASSDWYVYIDINKEIHFDYISKIGDIPYHQEKEAYKEMNIYKDILINKYKKEVVYIKK